MGGGPGPARSSSNPKGDVGASAPGLFHTSAIPWQALGGPAQWHLGTASSSLSTRKPLLVLPSHQAGPTTAVLPHVSPLLPSAPAHHHHQGHLSTGRGASSTPSARGCLPGQLPFLPSFLGPAPGRASPLSVSDAGCDLGLPAPRSPDSHGWGRRRSRPGWACPQHGGPQKCQATRARGQSCLEKRQPSSFSKGGVDPRADHQHRPGSPARRLSPETALLHLPALPGIFNLPTPPSCPL